MADDTALPSERIIVPGADRFPPRRTVLRRSPDKARAS